MSSYSDSTCCQSSTQIATHINVALLIRAENLFDPDSLLCEFRQRPLVRSDSLLLGLAHKVGKQQLLDSNIKGDTSCQLVPSSNHLDVRRVDRRLRFRRRQQARLPKGHHRRSRRHGSRVVDQVVLLASLPSLRVVVWELTGHAVVERDARSFADHGKARQPLQLERIPVSLALGLVPEGWDGDYDGGDCLGVA